MLGMAVAQTTAPPRNVTSICTGMRVGTNIQNVNDCGAFFACSSTGPVAGRCSTGYEFNSTLGNCARAPSPDCFACPKEPYFIDLPVDYQCLQFVRCFAGHAHQHTCSDGLLFDPKLKQCNRRSEVECPCPTSDIPARPLFVRDWNKCNQ